MLRVRHVVYGADFPATPDASLRSEASWNQKLIPVSPSYSILFVPQYMGGPSSKELASFIRRYFEWGGSMFHSAIATIEDMQAGLMDLEGKGKEVAVSIGAFSVTMNEMNRLSMHLPADKLNRNEHHTTR